MTPVEDTGITPAPTSMNMENLPRIVFDDITPHWFEKTKKTRCRIPAAGYRFH